MTDNEALWGYAGDLHRYAAFMCRHPEDAEDVAQNTLIKAAQKIDGFRGEASVRTWLHTIATNECRMLRRRAPSSELNEEIEHALFDGLGGSPSGRADPELLAIEAEERREVVRALQGLPERYQQVLVLKDGCGLPSAEVAHLLQDSIPAVKSVLHRARSRLRNDLVSV